MAVDVRAAGEQLMRETLADELRFRNFRYLAVRPEWPPATYRPGQVVVADCSKGVQFVCRVAGGPDPMGRNWDGFGNSQTLWLRAARHLTHPAELLALDIVTFGFDGEEHAALVLATGSDPLLWSHGHPGAPNSYRLSWDRRPAQYLRYPVGPLEPPNIDRLRSHTTWFAWMAWQLGEGEWRPFRKKNPRVRPNVPTRIPPTWWRRRARFLARRAAAH